MNDGKSVEVGLAGKEGFIGLPMVAGFRSSGSRVVTQAATFRISVTDMREVLRQCPKLGVSLLRYSQEATMEVTPDCGLQSSDEIDQRLAR